MHEKERAWIEINPGHLMYNAKKLQRILPKGCDLMSVVKANAYGHGAPLTAGVLQGIGFHDFCVACVSEGIELRNAGIKGAILVLGFTNPSQFSELSYFNLTQTAVDEAYAGELDSFGHGLKVHVGIDTGMHRLGERSDKLDEICKIWDYKNIEITGAYSHLCTCDGNTEAEKNFTLMQIQRFRYVLDMLKQRGISGFKTHLQSSYGVLNYPGLTFDYARIGIALYGVLSNPLDQTAINIALKPVLSLKARIVCVKKIYSGENVGYGLAYTAPNAGKIAVVSIGYADGIPRALSARGHALVKGRKVPIIGRICMDQLLLNVTNVDAIRPGDEAVFIGKSDSLEITASEAAFEAGTIANELLCRLGKRLGRVVLSH